MVVKSSPVSLPLSYSSSTRFKQLTNELLNKSNDWIACNIYISTAASCQAIIATKGQNNETTNNRVPVPKESPEEEGRTASSTFPLLTVLQSSQELCRKLRSTDQNARIAIVHAYADNVYDRSSIHLAGRAKEVAQVSSHVTTNVIDLLLPQLLLKSNKAKANQKCWNHDPVGGISSSSSSSSRHPLVGLIDHVSMMPLPQSTIHLTESENVNDCLSLDPSCGNVSDHDYDKHHDDNDIDFLPCDAPGLAALSVAHVLEEKGVQCLRYGTAHPRGTPLATVRRESTDFFQSGSLSLSRRENAGASTCPATPALLDILGTCTIGSPCHFVENFNIRLSHHVTKQQAMTLTKKVRERNGGVPGVEALTLPYSNGRWEVACNLLKVHQEGGTGTGTGTGTVDCIMEKVREWVEEQQEKYSTDDFSHRIIIEDAYRVGTTVEQCIQVLNLKGEEEIRHYDDKVQSAFQTMIRDA